MPRVPLIPLDQLDSDDRAALEALAESHTPGADIALFQALAHRPPLFRAALSLWQALSAPGALTLDLKALVAVRTAQINHCVY